MIVMLLLNIVLWMLIIVFALIFLLLVLPITFELCYDNGKFDFKIKMWFLRFDNLAKWLSTRKSKKPKNEPKKENSSKKLKDIKSTAKNVKAILASSGKIIKMLIKSIKFKNLNLRITIGSEEASKTATTYGAVCAAVYPAASALISCNEPKNYDISVRPDFLSEKIKIL